MLVLAVRGEETILAERPMGLRALRALIAASLLLALAAGEVKAAGTVAAHGGDPSTAGADLAWQQPGVGGSSRAAAFGRSSPATTRRSAATFVAWRSGPTVTVASRDTLAPVVQESIPGAQKLAVSDRWLVWRSAARSACRR